MDFLQEFNRIMEHTEAIALATSVNNVPNVRVVNFYYDTGKNVVYISAFKNSQKTLDFAQNNKVAFTTIPVGNSEQVRVNNGIVKKSALTIYDLKDAFVKKLSNYEMIIASAGQMLEVYEIHFTEANVILGINQNGKVTF